MFKTYDNTKLLVSLHLPKTAGTTLQNALRTWFGDRLHDHYPGRPWPLTWTELEHDACVHGHFTWRNGSSVEEYYPQAEQIIAIMRDPFDRLVSEWRFRNMIRLEGRPESDLADSPSFDTWFGRRADEVELEPVTRVMMHMPYRLTPETVDTAFDRNFVAVGLSEEFLTTLRLFARALNKPVLPEERVNVTTFGDAEDYEPYRSRHEQVFHSDHELYAAARRAFHQLKDIYDIR